MLTQLKIENYALIEQLDILPSKGLNIITGETGAGKSIMLGAVGLLLGNRADTKVLSDTNVKCVIEGVFHIGAYGLKAFFEQQDLDFEESTIIRREITPSGKSRAFVNDTPVTLDILKSLSADLMDVHSQHETLMLANNSFQISLIDYFAGNIDLLAQYQQQYKQYREIQTSISVLENDMTQFQKEHDYHQFLLTELSEANLQVEEQEELEQELTLLENSEEIKSGLHAVDLILTNGEQNVDTSLQNAKVALQKLRELSDKYEELYQRLESATIELRDIASEVELASDDVTYDPVRIDFVKERLGLIYQLQQKHQTKSIKELLDIEEGLSSKVLKTGELEEQLIEIKAKLSSTERIVLELGQILSEKRKDVFISIKNELEGLLGEVGMPDAIIEVSAQPTDPSPYGLDKITILFSANKGISPAPIGKVASGGELSRLMFCAKFILADKTSLPTVIFDEIDAGISGEVAMKMGRMMALMAQNHQVITITHLPQIAALAHSHYFVYKNESQGKTVSEIKMLNFDQRLEEVAKMIGGDNPSEAAFGSAKELIASM